MPRIPVVLLLLLVSPGCSCPRTAPAPWSRCAGGNPGAPECAIVLPVSIGEVSAEPTIACTGFVLDSSGDPCSRWPGGLIGPSVREGRFHRTFLNNNLYGHKLELEVEMTGADAGRARFCRSYFTDVVGDQCPPSDWTCASEGTVVLSAVPTDGIAPSAVRGEIHVTFPGGETVDAVF